MNTYHNPSDWPTIDYGLYATDGIIAAATFFHLVYAIVVSDRHARFGSGLAPRSSINCVSFAMSFVVPADVSCWIEEVNHNGFIGCASKPGQDGRLKRWENIKHTLFTTFNQSKIITVKLCVWIIIDYQLDIFRLKSLVFLDNMSHKTQLL